MTESHAAPISPRDFDAPELADWRVVGEGACAFFRTGSFARGAELVHAIARLSGLDAHHPDVDVRHHGVTVRLFTLRPGYYGLTERDRELARAISSVARELGTFADPTGLQNLQISIDSPAGPEATPFWRAVLGYQDRGDDPGELVDPRARGPIAYCQHIRASHPRRSQIHLDLWVAHDQADARIAAALAAGGRIVDDANAPSYTTLEDSEGNRICVCSCRSR